MWNTFLHFVLHLRRQKVHCLKYKLTMQTSLLISINQSREIKLRLLQSDIVCFYSIKYSAMYEVTTLSPFSDSQSVSQPASTQLWLSPTNPTHPLFLLFLSCLLESNPSIVILQTLDWMFGENSPSKSSPAKWDFFCSVPLENRKGKMGERISMAGAE